MTTCSALDCKDGAADLEHRSGIDQNIDTVCCGWDNRGVASTGKGLPWLSRRQCGGARRQDRQGSLEDTRSAAGRMATTITSAPLYHSGVSIPASPVAIVRRAEFLAALDAKTRKGEVRF